jgi:hypothetical protein
MSLLTCSLKYRIVKRSFSFWVDHPSFSFKGDLRLLYCNFPMQEWHKLLFHSTASRLWLLHLLNFTVIGIFLGGGGVRERKLTWIMFKYLVHTAQSLSLSFSVCHTTSHLMFCKEMGVLRFVLNTPVFLKIFFRGGTRKIVFYNPGNPCLWKRRKKVSEKELSDGDYFHIYSCRTNILAIFRGVFIVFCSIFK